MLHTLTAISLDVKVWRVIAEGGYVKGFFNEIKKIEVHIPFEP